MNACVLVVKHGGFKETAEAAEIRLTGPYTFNVRPKYPSLFFCNKEQIP